jgi:hypothetical protein
MTSQQGGEVSYRAPPPAVTDFLRFHVSAYAIGHDE